MKKKHGFFITFEGIEGAGKTTQSKRLFEVLRDKGYPVVFTREPGGTPIGDRIRAILIDPGCSEMVPLAELFLFAAARVQHIHQVIRPLLEEGRIVICDRFTDATLAYQGYGRGIPITQVREINEAASWTVRPDLTLLLDVEPYQGLSRVHNRAEVNDNAPDRLEREKADFHERVRRGYLDISYEEPQRFRRFDSTLDLDVVHGQILDCVMRELDRSWGTPQRLDLGSLFEPRS